MAPRLKVFVTSDGLTDYVVAVSSRAKALAAWGSHQDLFKNGSAHETTDPALVKAAAAKPGEVLRRPAGTRGELAKLKAAPAKSGPSKAALRKVATLEAKAEALEATQAAARQTLEDKRADLDRQFAELEDSQADARRRLEADLNAARAALG